MARNAKQQKPNALELAMMTQKKDNPAAGTMMGLAEDSEVEGLETGMDDDWRLLYNMTMNRDQYAGNGSFFNRPDKVHYRGANLVINKKTHLAGGDPLSVFSGITMELSGTVMNRTDSREGKKGREFHGTGGVMVLAPANSANAAVALVKDVTLSNSRLTASAGKENEDRGLTFLEPGKQYVYAKSLELEDDTISLLDATRYSLEKKRWEELEGATITDRGIDVGTVIPAAPAEEEVPDQEELHEVAEEVPDQASEETESDETQETEEAGGQEDLALPDGCYLFQLAPIKVRGLSRSIGAIEGRVLHPDGNQGGDGSAFGETMLTVRVGANSYEVPALFHKTETDGLSGGNLMISQEDKPLFELLALEYDRDFKTWYIDGWREAPQTEEDDEDDEEDEGGEEDEDLTVGKLLEDPLGTAKKLPGKVKEAAADYKEKANDAVDILSSLVHGQSLSDIADQYEEKYGGEETENSDALFHKKLNVIEISVPLFPGLDAEFKIDGVVHLDKELEIPHTNEESGNLEMSAALTGLCAVECFAGIATGVPYLFSIGGGLKGKVAARGAGNKNALVSGKFIVGYKKELNEETGKMHTVLTKAPELQLDAGIVLEGSVGASVEADSKIFGWSKSLWEIEFGKWELARVQGTAVLGRESTDLSHPFSGWKFTDASVQVNVFGNEMYEKTKSSNFGIQNRTQLVAEGNAYNQEQYEQLLAKLQLFLERKDQLVMIGAGDDSGFVAMVEEAKALKSEIQRQLELENLALVNGISTLEGWMSSEDYRDARNESLAGIQKHKEALKALEDAPDQEPVELSHGFKQDRIRKLKKELLFGGQGEALAYYKEKERLELEADPLKKVKTAHSIGEGTMNTPNPAYARACMKALGRSKEDVLRRYATLEDILQYEETRKAVYEQESAAMGRKLTKAEDVKKGRKDYDWIRLGGIRKILDYEREKAEAEKKKADDAGDTARIDAVSASSALEETEYLAASKEELLSAYRQVLMADTSDAGKVKKQRMALMKRLQKDDGESSFRDRVAPYLSLELLLNYEELRLVQKKTKKASEKELEVHSRRIDTLKYAIARRNQRNKEQQPEEAEKEEQKAIHQYLHQADTEKAGKTKAASRFLRELKRENTAIPGLDYQLIAKEAQLQFQGADWVNKLQATSFDDATALLDMELPKEVQGPIAGVLKAKRVAEGEQANLGLYKQIKKLQLYRNGKTYSHTERYNELLKFYENNGQDQADPDGFLQLYFSLGGGAGYAKNFKDFSSITMEQVNAYASTDFVRNEEWLKHNVRMNQLRRVPPEAAVNTYLEMISDRAWSKNFVSSGYEKVMNRLTPAQIAEGEKQTSQYTGIVTFLSQYLDENGLKPDLDEAAVSEAYEQYEKRFEKDHHGFLDTKKAQIKAGLLSSGRNEVMGYQSERQAFYEKKLAGLEETKERMASLANEMVGRIHELQEQVETLDGIIADPSGFLSSSAPLPEDHPLVDTAGQLESQDNLEEIQDAEELLQIITLDEELVLGE